MAISPTWRGVVEFHEAPAAFAVSRTLSLTTTWAEMNVRATAFASGPDVIRKVRAALGLASDSEALAAVRARAVFKRLDVQNLGGDAAELSEEATAGSSDAPAPPDAYLTAPAGGGVLSLPFPTRAEVVTVQLRAAADATTVQVRIWFDLPEVG